jgi:lipopolysaccharide transport system ATP-binding protein
LTGRENIFLNGTILGMSKFEINRKFDEIVEFAEIENFSTRPSNAIRAACTCVWRSPSQRICTRKFSWWMKCLPSATRSFKKVSGKMGNAAREGRTVLFVSHNMDAVRKLCTRGVLLEQGGVEMIGDAEAVIRKYLDGGTDVRSAYMIPPPDAQENAPGYAYKLVVENGNGEPTVSIPVGQAWQVRVHFRITRRTEHFIIALGLRSSRDGIPLRTSWACRRQSNRATMR